MVGPKSRQIFCSSTKQFCIYKWKCGVFDFFRCQNIFKTMELYREELENAISSGDALVASNAAKLLAEVRSNLRLRVRGTTGVNFPDKKISVKIIIEDRLTSNVSLTLKLSPSMTFAELKSLMFEKFEFPPLVQKWLAGKRLTKDSDTLHGCGVRKDNDIIYMYIVSAKSVGLTREAADKQYKLLSAGCSSSVRNGNFLAPVVAAPASIVLPPSSAYNDETLFVRNSPMLNPLHLPNTTSDCVQAPLQAAIGWTCPECTFINEPTRPGCDACSMSRPEEYVIPGDYELSINERRRMAEEQKIEEALLQQRQLNFKLLLAAEENSLIPSTDVFECPVCFEIVPPGCGITLRECLHVFCRDCLQSQVRHADSSVVACPFNNGLYQCPCALQEREIRALVPGDLYQKHLTLSLVEAESRSANSFHCQTPNCIGWCIYEDDVNAFECPACGRDNCLTCKAIHENVSCKQYQDEVRQKATNDLAAKQTQDKIEAMLQKGDAMKCPTCDIIVMKKDGCDWIRCTMCKTEICWVTKGPRWGPNGPGDITSGCKCGVDGKLCHQNCQNCH